MIGLRVLRNERLMRKRRLVSDDDDGVDGGFWVLGLALCETVRVACRVL